jgi:serine phosphatase RsbU (regulator of sigma subunit)
MRPFNHSKNLWLGTSEGLVKLNLENNDSFNAKPILQVRKVLINNKEVNWKSETIELKPGFYDLQVDYIAMSLRNPEKILYQTKLKGLTPEWSDSTISRSVNFNRLNEGNYSFMIRSFDDEGKSEELENAFAVFIKKPLYLRTWFWIVIASSIAFLFYLTLKARVAQQKRIQRYLEIQLERRTREVTKQKDEIEKYNKEITDSINYAKEIQTSLLPVPENVDSHFNASFILFKPRNIVSGDFYWFDRLDANRVIVVAADATGHGVPGGFMSMIGTTVIKDILSHYSNISPGKLLLKLDDEVRRALNQNCDSITVSDGMDITVMIYDADQRLATIASAMQSYIIQRNTEQIYQRGSKHAIGGRYFDMNKEFENVKFTLNKGDKIYLYSDGFVDQFGGPDQKKYKIGRFRSTLESIQLMPMNEQAAYLENEYEDWKGDEEQVDDILIMGLEI